MKNIKEELKKVEKELKTKGYDLEKNLKPKNGDDVELLKKYVMLRQNA